MSRNVSGAKEKIGDQYNWVEADVTQQEDIEHIVERTLEHLGRIDRPGGPLPAPPAAP